MNEHILLVEDEEALRITLTDRLRSEGYVVESSADGDDGLDKARRLPFDLIILDVMLPRRSGLDVCRDIRRGGSPAPILMMSARNQTIDKVVGLKLGADDYLSKPFEAAELLARVEALLRRAPSRNDQANFEFGNVVVDIRGTSVTRDGVPVGLSAREFQLLRYLIEHRGKTLSRDEILRDVWGYSTTTLTRTVDVHVASLRNKLETDSKHPRMILTVPGLGYKLAAE
jgi:two-component system alkaline phosphatase synthesis response regulator PhoP